MTLDFQSQNIKIIGHFAFSCSRSFPPCQDEIRTDKNQLDVIMIGLDQVEFLTMVKRKVPFAFMAKMTNLPSKASVNYQCPIACLTFQVQWPINSSSNSSSRTPKTIQIHAFFHFLENQAISAKLRNIAFLSLSKNNDEIWCQTCFMITNKLVPNLKSN